MPQVSDALPTEATNKSMRAKFSEWFTSVKQSLTIENAKALPGKFFSAVFNFVAAPFKFLWSKVPAAPQPSLWSRLSNFLFKPSQTAEDKKVEEVKAEVSEELNVKLEEVKEQVEEEIKVQEEVKVELEEVEPEEVVHEETIVEEVEQEHRVSSGAPITPMKDKKKQLSIKDAIGHAGSALKNPFTKKKHTNG